MGRSHDEEPGLGSSAPFNFRGPEAKMIDVTIAELKESLFHTMSGYGNLKVNHKIKAINTILLDRHNIPRTQSMKNFIGYFYERKLDQRLDRSKCSLQTYLN